MFTEYKDENYKNISMIGLTLDSYNPSERQRYFDDWAKEYCTIYNSLDDANKNLPFTIRLPNYPAMLYLRGIYVPKRDLSLSFAAVALFEHGINGINLIISKQEATDKIPGWDTFTYLGFPLIKLFELVGSSPMIIGLFIGDLFYMIQNGWEEPYSKEELIKILLSLT